jgi:sugar phosphate isomerase/epimerase
MKGPAIFLAQFIGEAAPMNSLEGLARWAAGLGYKGIQLPTWDPRIFDLSLADESNSYCSEVQGLLADCGVEITELSTHAQGQLVAVHPAYDALFDGFAPPQVQGNPAARQEWAVDQLHKVARVSGKLGLTSHASFSGSLAWPYVYPWPQRPAGLVETAFDELARRWMPILDSFRDNGVAVCYELHPGEDLFDGATFEMFLERTGNHPACRILYDPSHFLLQQLDYLAFLDIYGDYVKAFHVKDAEFRPTGRQGVYSGYAGWVDRAGRFRSLGDGQIDFRAIFSRLTARGFDGWAVLEWECCLKHPEDGAREGATFIRDHMIRTADKAFDDFAASGADRDAINRLLGIGGAA